MSPGRDQKRALPLLYLFCLSLSGCTTFSGGDSAAWTTERGKMGTFPEFAVFHCAGEDFPELRPRHHFQRSDGIVKPDGFSWGQEIDVRVRHHSHTPPPSYQDACSHQYYAIEETFGSSRVPAGTCFDLDVGSIWHLQTIEAFSHLFEPNVVSFQPASLKDKLSRLLQEARTESVKLSGCFPYADRLDIEIVSIEAAGS